MNLQYASAIRTSIRPTPCPKKTGSVLLTAKHNNNNNNKQICIAPYKAVASEARLGRSLFLLQNRFLALVLPNLNQSG